MSVSDGEFHSSLVSIQDSLATLSLVDELGHLDVLEGWTPLDTPYEAPVIDPPGFDLDAISALDCESESRVFSITKAFMALECQWL